ncbi:MAG: hypothetical protein DPW09_36995 [Anaerolineae bacterium]|nr:hypothetical protein [Anaerolineae bacterium]
MSDKATIDISVIQILPEFVSREHEVNQETVDRYREILDTLPEIEVWQNPETGAVCLLNGRHRLEANRAEKYAEVEVVFFEGSYEDALVRARVGNIDHGLSYTKKEWRQAIKDVVRLRHRRANAWIAREASCSALTVSRIRGELEKAGEIPWLEFLETENGQTIQRRAKEEEAEDSFPEATEALNHPTGDEPQGKEGEAANRDTEEKQDAEEQGVELGHKVEHGAGEESGSDNSNLASEQKANGAPVNVTLKLGQLGETLAVEAGIWVNGELQSVPVTLMIATNSPKGLVEAAPGYGNCLIISQAVAKSLNLLFN